MGQNNSRRREPSDTSASAVLPAPTVSPGPSSEAHQDDPSRRVQHIEAPELRKPSIRKSLLNLVKPGKIRSRVNSITSAQGDLRPWRNSRRLSKAPVDAVLQSEDPSRPALSLPVAGPSTVDKGKQPERNSAIDDEDEDDYHEAVEEELTRPPTPTPTSDNHVVQAAPSEPIAHFLEGHSEHGNTTTEQFPPVFSQEIPDNNSEALPTHPSSLPPTPRPHTVPLPARQFPPPGTLVIVQGVVHTTDVPRPLPREISPLGLNLEAQDDQNQSRTRDRLSALLRPRSVSRRPSTNLTEAPAPTVTSAGTETPVSTSGESLSSPAMSAQTGLTVPTADEHVVLPSEPQHSPLQPESVPLAENQLPSISSSSIDVLGTLLSVAAAATAASLLTGSSEPILSSGLAPPPSTPFFPRPSPPLGGDPLPRPVPEAPGAGRTERMRQAWGTMRERLGLRPSAPPTEPAATANDRIFPTTEVEGPDSSPTDARELMLAEMARAFNVGLGLNGLGSLSSNSNEDAIARPSDTEVAGTNSPANVQNNGENPAPPSTANEATNTPRLPPEGSFERFIVDLQVDLRLALTHVDEEVMGTADTQHGQAQQADIQDEQSSPSQHSSPSTPLTSSPLRQPASSLSSGVGGQLVPPVVASGPQTSDPILPPNLVHQEGQPSNVPGIADTDPVTDFVPRLSDDHDSDSEGGHDDDGYNDEDFHSAVNGVEDHHIHPDLDGRNGASTRSGVGHIDGSGRINWWRLYRFPQITPPSIGIVRQASSGEEQADNSSFQNPDSSNQASTSAAEIPSFMPIQSDTMPPTTVQDPIAPMNSVPISTTRQLPRTVVPVIIVGLQSVDPGWRPGMPTNEGIDPSGHNQGETGDEDVITASDANVLGASTGEASRGRGRPRRWPSRAATAIRNLRPGRRNVDSGPTVSQPFPPPNGSRTFLIYVIGGYYPPDHSIVTGGPSNFDSFEALLELADLLGQVKPTTVSKDDIEKSGLEVIKPASLQEYFKDEKITANCLERCLVCLEDYQEEEEIRIMRCRHAFHKVCVDEWMQKGRNNCPACRSMGVPMDAHDPHDPPVLAT